MVRLSFVSIDLAEQESAAVHPLASRGTPGHELDARDLVLRYGRTAVVHGVDLQIRPGEVTVLLGPNGSGKSTVLRAVSRLHPLGGGSVRIAERETSLMGAREFACALTLFSQSRGLPQGSPCGRSSPSGATPTGAVSPR